MSGPPFPPRLVFVNRFYWPDEQATAQLLTDLAEGLARRGRQVAVIASADPRASGPKREIRNGVEILRVSSTRWGRHGMAAKAVDYLTFARTSRRLLRGQLAPDDRVIVMTDPPLLAPIAAGAARRAGARVVHWLQDIHPEVGLALHPSRLLEQLSSPWVRRRDTAWQNAWSCVAISEDMAGLVAEHGVPPANVRVIHNWAPGGGLTPVAADQNPLRREWNVADQFVVAYSGNLGRVHALEPVLAAADVLRHDCRQTFLFIGDGPQRPALEAAAKARGLRNVRFLPAQPRARLAQSLSVGDVHLVTLRVGCERCVYPSKLYGILAVARPVLFVGPPQCGLARTVREQGFGLTVAPGDAGALAAAVRTLRDDASLRTGMAEASARWALMEGGVDRALEAWDALLQGA